MYKHMRKALTALLALLLALSAAALAESLTASVEKTAGEGENTFTVNACITIILKIAIDVEILLPSYGYCAIPPAQDYSQEVCAGFFELPLYPQGNIKQK